MFFKVITAMAVTVAVLAAPTPDHRGASNGTAIPLTARHFSLLDANKNINVDALKSHVASHNAKIIRGMNNFDRNTGMPHPFAVQRDRSGAGVVLTNHENSVWYGTISIGTSAQSFNVQFDTGSADLFVPTSTGDQNCRSHANLWDPTGPHSSARSLNLDFYLHFADGATVMGSQYTDKVTIAGFTADAQAICAATTCSSELEASKFAADGILGLALPSLSASPSYNPLFHTLFYERKLPQPVFSFMLTASGGELYAGGMNEAHYIASSLTFTPVTTPAFWQVNIDKIEINGQIVQTHISAVINTGSVLIFGDEPSVSALHRAHGGKAFMDGVYTFPCSSFPSVTFTIGGKQLLVPANVLNIGKVQGGEDCFSAIMDVGNQRFWTIGVIFLQLFYTVFDFGSEPPRVGFATLVNPGPPIHAMG